MKLLLGCGDTQREGWVHHDRRRHSPHVEVAHDLNVFPWPWADNSADEIEATDVLEHLEDTVGFMDECWRILRPGGRLRVRAVHYRHENLWLDPTHRRGFHPQTFDYFDPERHWGRVYGHLYTGRHWRVIRTADLGDAVEANLEPRKRVYAG